MNRHSRTDESDDRLGWNQSPPSLSGDTTTRADLNGIANLRTGQDTNILPHGPSHVDDWLDPGDPDTDTKAFRPTPGHLAQGSKESSATKTSASYRTAHSRQPPTELRKLMPPFFQSLGSTLVKFSKFIGPGFMVAVAYIDPGNYATDVAAGAATRFKLLFIILMSNVFAIVLQSLAVRLGTVTGLNLAESCRAHLPRWLNIALYVLAEGAIIATDIAEVKNALHLHGTPQVLTCMTGHWLGHRPQPVAARSFSRRVCHYPHRRSDHPDLLQPRWFHATP